ncbi:MAG: hypothetical protein JXR42_04910 [Gammaproteobacteria bacterium]|nr:hypothetical protein [Gammaproteobacteria bacterium]
MKTKKFSDYLTKRLDKVEIAEIEAQAELEILALEGLRQDVAAAFGKYMTNSKIGFNEAVRRLQMSPTQITKIQKGEANLTLASIAHIGALLKMRPHIVFKKA